MADRRHARGGGGSAVVSVLTGEDVRAAKRAKPTKVSRGRGGGREGAVSPGRGGVLLAPKEREADLV